MKKQKQRKQHLSKQVLSLILSAAMIFTLPAATYAVEDTSTDSGLCQHHPAHDEDCGYSAGSPCSHEHTDECYETVEKCIHKHTDECYEENDNDSPSQASPPQAQTQRTLICTHECTVESGCITQKLNCPHVHDEDCGYVPASPCTYDCQICTESDSSTGTGNDHADVKSTTVITGFEALDESVRIQTVPAGTERDDLNLPAALNATGYRLEQTLENDTWTATESTEEELIIDVEWKVVSAKDTTNETASYDSKGGTFRFAPVLTKDYKVEDGVNLPEITVTVVPDNTLKLSVDNVIALIDALPSMEEIEEMDNMSSEEAASLKNRILAAKKAYDALSDEDKALIDAEHTEKLMTLVSFTEIALLSQSSPAPTVRNKNIFANGIELRIVAGTSTDTNGNPYTNILYDADGNNSIDNDEFLTIGDDAPSEAGYDLSAYSVYGGSEGTDTDTEITANPSITMEGGTLNSIYGGGLAIKNMSSNPPKTSVNGSTSITMNGGKVSTIFGGGRAETNVTSIVTQDTEVNICGGTVGSVAGGGMCGASKSTTSVEGTASITITDAVVEKDVYGGGVCVDKSATATTGGSSVTVGGKAKIGNNTNNWGLRLNGGDPEKEDYTDTGVDTFTISPDLESDSEIVVILPTDYPVDTVLATDAVSTDADYVVLAGKGHERLSFKFDSDNDTLVTYQELKPSFDSGTLYANGTALYIEGGADGKGTIYLDTNRNGKKDDGELSLAGANIYDAPADNSSISFPIYGGSNGEDITSDTKITMTGGTVGNIYGGCHEAKLEGNTEITVTGGKTGKIYGGGHHDTKVVSPLPYGVTGSTSVTVSGGLVNGPIYGGGLAENKEVRSKIGGNTKIVITGDSTVNGNIYGGGHAKQRSTSNITGSTSIIISTSGNVNDVFGGGHIDSTDEIYGIAEIEGSTSVSISGPGKVNNVYGSSCAVGGEAPGSTSEYTKPKAIVHGTTDVKVSGGEITGSVYGGGYAEWGGALPSVLGNSSVTISGGTIAQNVYGGGYATRSGWADMGTAGSGGTAGRTVTSVTINGGTISGYVAGAGEVESESHINGAIYIYGNILITITNGTVCGNVYGLANIRETGIFWISVLGKTEVVVGNKAKIGDSDGNGIVIIDPEDYDKNISASVTSFEIEPNLEEGAKIYAKLPKGIKNGTVIATSAIEADKKFVNLTGDGAENMSLKYEDNQLILEKDIKPTIDAAKHTVYANGKPLLITGAGGNTTIYLDNNGNGQKDSDEPSLKGASLSNAPDDNTDLSEWTIYGGSLDEKLTGSTQITMIGGKLKDIVGGGYASAEEKDATIAKNTVINITGGEVSSIYGGGHAESKAIADVTGSRTITAGGTAKIGDKAKKTGIILNGGDDGDGNTVISNGVDAFAISDSVSLATGAELNVVIPSGYKSGTIATNAKPNTHTYVKLTGDGSDNKMISFNSSDNILHVSDAPTVEASAHHVYANGIPLLITGTSDSTSTIIIDTNGNGIKDTDELSLKGANIENAPDDGSDLSGWTIYGGYGNAELTGNTKITMNSGKVNTIVGGGYSTLKPASVTGNTSVTIIGGTVASDIYGGGFEDGKEAVAAVTGIKSITVGGKAVIGSSANHGIIINTVTVTKLARAASTGTANGVDNFIINPDLADGSSVYVSLPANYTSGVIATEAVSGDTEHIKLTGAGAVDKMARFDSTNHTIKVKDKSFIITLQANGGTVTPLSVETDKAGKLTASLPTPSRNGSYTFDGWFTAVTDGDAVTTDTIFTKDSTVYAHWTYTGSNSSGSNSSSGSTTYKSWLPGAYKGTTKVIHNVIVPSYTVEGTWKIQADGRWRLTGQDGKDFAGGWVAAYNPFADVSKGQSMFDWYLFDADGFMVPGWYTDESGNTYYLNPIKNNVQGAMETGWTIIDGKYYYFNEVSDGTRGRLYRNEITPDGYYVDANGVWDGKTKR